MFTDDTTEETVARLAASFFRDRIAPDKAWVAQLADVKPAQRDLSTGSPVGSGDLEAQYTAWVLETDVVDDADIDVAVALFPQVSFQLSKLAAASVGSVKRKVTIPALSDTVAGDLAEAFGAVFWGRSGGTEDVSFVFDTEEDARRFGKAVEAVDALVRRRRTSEAVRGIKKRIR